MHMHEWLPDISFKIENMCLCWYRKLGWSVKVPSIQLSSLMLVLREIGNNNKAMLPWLFVQKEKYNKMCCPLEAIRPSPVQVNHPHTRMYYYNLTHNIFN